MRRLPPRGTLIRYLRTHHMSAPSLRAMGVINPAALDLRIFRNWLTRQLRGWREAARRADAERKRETAA